MAGDWVALYSGGKDSSWALYRALERGLSVEHLLTVHPPADSYMFHVPATDLATLAAESVGIPLVEVDATDGPTGVAADAGARGDAELEPLAAALSALDARPDASVGGLVAGAVASEYQADRVEDLAREFDAGCFAPLWHRDPRSALEAMLEAGFEIRILQVAARGLDESWLGRTLDADAVDDLVALGDAHGVHPLGEGGEFETLVTDGPHMDRPIEIAYDTDYDGTRGTVQITDAWLG